MGGRNMRPTSTPGARAGREGSATPGAGAEDPAVARGDRAVATTTDDSTSDAGHENGRDDARDSLVHQRFLSVHIPLAPPSG